MADVVQDIDRPDVNGVPPKMKAIADELRAALKDIAPFFFLEVSDNLCSHINIRISFQPKDQWINGIFYNSPYALISIDAPGRYYNPGDKLVVECKTLCSSLPKFRKATLPTAEKVIAKIKKWAGAK